MSRENSIFIYKNVSIEYPSPDSLPVSFSEILILLNTTVSTWYCLQELMINTPSYLKLDTLISVLLPLLRFQDDLLKNSSAKELIIDWITESCIYPEYTFKDILGTQL